MVRRIKTGLRKRKKALANNPSILDPKWIGFAERPAIEKITGLPYEEVKSKVLDFFVAMLLGGVKRP